MMLEACDADEIGVRQREHEFVGCLPLSFPFFHRPTHLRTIMYRWNA